MQKTIQIILEFILKCLFFILFYFKLYTWYTCTFAAKCKLLTNRLIYFFFFLQHRDFLQYGSVTNNACKALLFGSLMKSEDPLIKGWIGSMVEYFERYGKIRNQQTSGIRVVIVQYTKLEKNLTCICLKYI